MESWWQQFNGEGIVGELVGTKLKIIPSKLESFEKFKERNPKGLVLNRPKNVRRNYGKNPYVGYETSNWPFLYRGEYDGPVSPMAYVVAVGKDAWPLALLREKKEIRYKDVVIRWESGQNSALGERQIAKGQDVGNVSVTVNEKPVVYKVPFAFAFSALEPDGIIHTTASRE